VGVSPKAVWNVRSFLRRLGYISESPKGTSPPSSTPQATSQGKVEGNSSKEVPSSVPQSKELPTESLRSRQVIGLIRLLIRFLNVLRVKVSLRSFLQA
jgi:negative regulator of replication initiation